MAIPDAYRRNFATLLRAAEDGNLALVECSDGATGEPPYVLCAVVRDTDANYVMTPFGHLAHRDSYEMYGPPEASPPEPIAA
jgi:hypothetical protein